MNDMINSMYRQGRPASSTSGNNVINFTHITPASSPANPQRSTSNVSGAHAESDDVQGKDSLKWCIDRKSNTNTPAEQMKQNGRHNNSRQTTSGNDEMSLIDVEGSNDEKVSNQSFSCLAVFICGSSPVFV